MHLHIASSEFGPEMYFRKMQLKKIMIYANDKLMTKVL